MVDNEAGGLLNSDIESIDSDDPTRQKRVPEIPLTSEQVDMLKNDTRKLLEGRTDCSQFVSGLLFNVAASTGLKLRSNEYLTEPLKIFDAVQSQRGYFLAVGQGASGYAWGGKITLDVGMNVDSAGSVSRGLLLLHENSHEAGSAGYLDRELAVAAYQTLWSQAYENIPPPPTTTDSTINSRYLTNAIFKACHPLQGKRFMK
jgi:hypothetical protein